MTARLDAEPSTTTFVYIVEGEPYVGTLNDYAKALEQECYGAITVEPDVWTWVEGGWQRVSPRVKVRPFDDNDYATMTVSAFGQTATVRIDGRA